MKFLRTLPCAMVPLAEVEHDLAHVLAGAGDEGGVPPPETSVKIEHGAAGHFRDVGWDGVCGRRTLDGANAHWDQAIQGEGRGSSTGALARCPTRHVLRMVSIPGGPPAVVESAGRRRAMATHGLMP